MHLYDFIFPPVEDPVCGAVMQTKKNPGLLYFIDIAEN